MSDHAALPLSAPDAIRARRAIRKFDPTRPLEDAMLKRILGLATLAPSSLNLQPWRFVVVRDERNRQRLRACAFNQPKVSEAPVVVIVLGYQNAHATHLDQILTRQVELTGMPHAAAAEFRGRAMGLMTNHPDRASWALKSSMIAATTMLIAASSLGVASAPMEGFDPVKVRQEFGVPDDHVVCCLVALGHALDDQPFPGRLGLDEVCYEEHFGRPWTLGEPE